MPFFYVTYKCVLVMKAMFTSTNINILLANEIVN